MHKLIIAQRRQEGLGKGSKDLLQAKALIEALSLSDPDAVDDALDNSRLQGRQWRAAINKSLKEIGLP